MNIIKYGYYDIVDEALKFMKSEVDPEFFLVSNEKEKADIALRLSSIIEFLDVLKDSMEIIVKDFQE